MAVEIKKTRAGQGVLNKPIGVVRLASGEDEVLSQKAQALGKVSNTFFELETERQVKFGKEYAAKIKAFDENGKVVYHDPVSIKGRVAYETAQSELNKKYAVALKQQTIQTAIEFRQRYKTEEEFSRNFSTWMDETAKNLSASGGDFVASTFLDDAGVMRQEHISDIKKKKLDLENSQAAAQYDIDMQNTAGYMFSAYAAGDIEEGDNNFENLFRSISEDAITVHGLTPSRRNDLLNFLTDSKRNGIILSSVGDKSAAEIAELSDGFDLGKIPEKFKKEMPFLEDLLQDTASSPVRRRNAQVFFSSLKQAANSAASESATEKKYGLWMSGNFSGNTKQDSMFSARLLQETTGIDTTSFAAMVADPEIAAKLTSPEATEVLRKTTIPAPILSVIEQATNNAPLEHIPGNQEGIALAVASTLTSITNYDGSITPKNLTPQQVAFVTSFDSMIRNVGADRATEAYLDTQKVISNDATWESAVAGKLGKQVTDKTGVITMAKSDLEDRGFPSYALDEFTPIYAKLLAHRDISADDAYTEVTGNFNTFYKDHPYMYPYYNRKHRYTPEYYYKFEGLIGGFRQSSRLGDFNTHLQKLGSGLYKTQKKGVENPQIGKDFFLVSSPSSTNTYGEWMFVDENNVPLVDHTGKPLSVNTTGFDVKTNFDILQEDQAAAEAESERLAELELMRRNDILKYLGTNLGAAISR